MKASILLVDDERPVTSSLSKLLRRHHYETFTASSGEEALVVLANQEVDVLIVDEYMPLMRGTELLVHAREVWPTMARILLTGQGSFGSALTAINKGHVSQYITKPCAPETLLVCVEAALRDRVQMVAAHKALAVVEQDRAERARFTRALAGLWLETQPIVDPATRSVVAYEVLVRSDEPTIPHGGAFIELAERVGGIVALEARVREESARILAMLPEDQLLFVNVHASSLADPAWRDGPLAPYASRVVLEVSEGATVRSLTECADAVKDLRGLGYRVAIDDLGAGNAGLGSLAVLQPDFVKLDRGLIEGIHGAPLRARIIASAALLCRDIGSTVIAEGVELVEEADALLALGVPLLQGYLYSRPGRPLPTVAWPPDRAPGRGPA